MTVVDERITPAWLNERLREVLPGGSPIIGVETVDVGTGTGFAGTVIRAQLRYDQMPGPLPSVMVKLPIRSGNTLETLKQQDLLLREARFYQQLAADVPISMPRVYHVDVNEAEDDFAILMEDLGDIKRPEALTLAGNQVEQALRAVAAVHARFWNHPVVKSDWLAPVMDGSDEARASQLESLVRGRRLLEQSEYDTDYCIECLDRLVKAIPKAPQRTYLPSPVTLIHGDFHPNNLHISDDEVICYDWQLVAKGTAASDVTNLLYSALEPEEYRTNRQHYLSLYHEALLAQGVLKFPYKKFNKSYNDAAFFNVLKFLVILGTVDFEVPGGEDMRDDMIRKLVVYATESDALGYCRKLPFMLLAMKFMNLVMRN